MLELVEGRPSGEHVDDLLDLAAGKADMVSVKRREVDLRAAVTETVERFRPVAGEKRIGLVVTVPPEPVSVWWDPADLERVLVNLVSNAVKYTTKGGVTVTVESREDRAVVSVSDSGIGIPQDALPHLFTEFYRAGNAKVVEESGTGLGLSIVKLLVERYGGSIVVETEEGRGTTFTVEAPVDKPLI